MTLSKSTITAGSFMPTAASTATYDESINALLVSSEND